MSSNVTLPLDAFYANEINQKDRTYLKQPINGKWIDYSWGEVGQEARKLAAAIKKMDLPDKSCIAIISKNCAHWIITDLAIWMAGHVSVPLYPTLAADTINYVLEHAEAKLVFIGKLDDWEGQKSGVPDSIRKVQFPHWNNSSCQKYEDFIADCEALKDTAHPTKDDLCTIIYTSGTTGNPKGVVHTFNSASTHMRHAMEKLSLNNNERFFSYLPLSHVAERLLVEMGSIYSGGTVHFAESLDTFKDNLELCRPTVFLAVPRIWLKFQQGILQKLPQKKLNLLLSIPIINGIIKKKLKTALGLDQVRYAVTGAAAISKDLLSWFDRIGIPILEAYGMTENFGVSNLSLPEAKKYGTVGKIFSPNTEVKIADNGEVCSRSEATMVEYYKNPEKTAETIDDDGWLHTGDQGEFDQDGFLKITGRVKDAFKTSKGKYVTPTKIEGHFVMCELIEQICVMGTGLPQPIAVCVLSEIGQAKSQEELNSELSALLSDVNGKIENYERMTHVVVVQDEWSIETGLVTPTLKLKRNVVEQKYAPMLSEWTAKTQKVLNFRS